MKAQIRTDSHRQTRTLNNRYRKERERTEGHNSGGVQQATDGRETRQRDESRDRISCPSSRSSLPSSALSARSATDTPHPRRQKRDRGPTGAAQGKGSTGITQYAGQLLLRSCSGRSTRSQRIGHRSVSRRTHTRTGNPRSLVCQAFGAFKRFAAVP